MTRSRIESEVYGLRRQGIKYDLDRMVALCDRLGHPERRYATLHVGGTNGKGSTAAFLAAMLQAAGYRVGLNTSPHLVSYRERIRVNAASAPEDELLETFHRLRPALDEVEASFFEATTMLAFAYFAEVGVDIAVFEVGLGGRLDATNVIEPLGSVITPLDLEHTRILGGTIAEIAREKAGIIKNHPVVTAAGQPEARAVIAGVARERGADLTVIEPDRDWTHDGGTLVRRDRRYPLGLVGRHQAENAALALELCERLDAAGTLRVPEPARRLGLAGTAWPGRFDVRRLPIGEIVFDVAHNAHGARALTVCLSERYPGVRPPLVVGMLKDKQHEPFLEAIAPIAGPVWATTPAHDERKLEAPEMAALCRAAGMACEIEESPGRAVERALAHGQPVLVTGSLFTVGQAMSELGISPADEPAGLRSPAVAIGEAAG